MDFTEIDDYLEWCKEHCTNALYKGIELSAENYKKAAISMSECERQPVGNNEQTEKKCHASEDGYTHAMCVSHTSCENCKAYR